MASVAVKVDSQRVTVALGAFALSTQANEQLLQIIGLLQLKSIRQTFRESGSPSGSWAPLSAASLSWSKYSAGHKLLINKGILLNSITSAVQGKSVVIGTGISYAEAQQEGFDGPQSVRPYSYTRRVRGRDTFGREAITNKAGRKQTVRRKVSSGLGVVNVRGFSRHIRIPARPYVVFRPEDPARIQAAAQDYCMAAAKQAGLETN